MKRGEQEIMKKRQRLSDKDLCPLRLMKIKFDEDSFHEISSTEEFNQIMEYILRIGMYEWYSEENSNNNVYMDYDIGQNVIRCQTTKSMMERKELRVKLGIREVKSHLDFNGKVIAETAKCYFAINNAELIKKLTIDTLKDSVLHGLFMKCDLVRRRITEKELENSGLCDWQNDIVLLRNVKDELFKGLLLDDMRFEEGYLVANMYSILLLK